MIKQIQSEQEAQLKHHLANHAHVHRYVTLHLKDVPVQRFGKDRTERERRSDLDSWETLEPGEHLFLTGLLPHEQCLSVLNIVLNRTNDSEGILKSKERLVFHIGFRRFSSSPIFSQHNNGDKHKVTPLFSLSLSLSLQIFDESPLH